MYAFSAVILLLAFAIVLWRALAYLHIILSRRAEHARPTQRHRAAFSTEILGEKTEHYSHGGRRPSCSDGNLQQCLETRGREFHPSSVPTTSPRTGLYDEIADFSSKMVEDLDVYRRQRGTRTPVRDIISPCVPRHDRGHNEAGSPQQGHQGPLSSARTSIQTPRRRSLFTEMIGLDDDSYSNEHRLATGNPTSLHQRRRSSHVRAEANCTATSNPLEYSRTNGQVVAIGAPSTAISSSVSRQLQGSGGDRHATGVPSMARPTSSNVDIEADYVSVNDYYTRLTPSSSSSPSFNAYGPGDLRVPTPSSPIQSPTTNPRSDAHASGDAAFIEFRQGVRVLGRRWVQRRAIDGHATPYDGTWEIDAGGGAEARGTGHGGNRALGCETWVGGGE
ncbi:uncharacterized protein HMPREF1541_02350 [Cyphellophora europaea CBS 101466]|uniref:Uncharacterized protein n=1 Tax=Cyphellophora europaea (strain CBS 101466) TaxID=1220924 RepID=W2S398_CYPE1|nr:uncharacterized protein HMPREF1541_02350 [Cyphellophora europaea CBS 101466]ETN43191.1 hypothetical protein HMPREF1541_02350 [Cyphellophora europaea CBS 101466]